MLQTKRQTNFIIIFLTFILACIIGIGAFFTFINYNYIILKSPYRQFELGLESVELDPEVFLSKDMKNRTKATISISESETEVEVLNNKVVTKDKNILNLGTYALQATLGNQKQSILVTIIDTQDPQFLNWSDEIIIPKGAINLRELKNYFTIFDMDETSEYAVYAAEINLNEEGTYPASVIAWDSSGNNTIKTVKIKVIDVKTEADKLRLTGMTESNYKGYVYTDKVKWDTQVEYLETLKAYTAKYYEDLAKEILETEEAYKDWEENYKDSEDWSETINNLTTQETANLTYTTPEVTIITNTVEEPEEEENEEEPEEEQGDVIFDQEVELGESYKEEKNGLEIEVQTTDWVWDSDTTSSDTSTNTTPTTNPSNTNTVSTPTIPVEEDDDADDGDNSELEIVDEIIEDIE